jgi:hypothetical protein
VSLDMTPGADVHLCDGVQIPEVWGRPVEM